eukprot:4751971-Lingulodinium_polyedra.AAC.1
MMRPDRRFAVAAVRKLHACAFHAQARFASAREVCERVVCEPVRWRKDRVFAQLFTHVAHCCGRVDVALPRRF